MSADRRGRGPAPASVLDATGGGLSTRARAAVTVAATAALALGVAGPAAAQAAQPSSTAPVSVVVREAPGAGALPEHVVAQFGGSVVRRLSIIHGFSAKVPADRLDALRATAGVTSVTEDARLTLSDADVAGQLSQPGSLYTLANQVTGAANLWHAGATGKGVDVALVDSGVVPVNGLTAPGKILYGPDLTEEAATAAENLDTYGHGTNMAGIIAGRDDAAAVSSGNSSDFLGMAPDARIVSIKIAEAQGQTDVSQAIAAIDWVVENGHKDGRNVRVLNMSFGTDGVQGYQLDPLAYAAEQAWHAGIVVVVAAGNSGNTSGRLNNPATDPYLIAVGSDNANGTAGTSDDAISSFSNGGDGVRNPDVVAPGDHVVSLRDAGSYLDTQFPAARIGDRLFRGSGTSQAAAVVSGSAALLLSQRPDLTPDQVKALLTGTAKPVPGAAATVQGHGLIDLAAAATAPTPVAVQDFRRSTGLGSLEAARGSVHARVDGREIRGEIDVHGQRFDAAAVAAGIRDRTNWSGIRWSGIRWSGIRWSGVDYSGIRWSGVDYSGIRWSGIRWSGIRWSSVDFSGIRWSGIRWSTTAWESSTWA
jgi:serine protease AprX